MMAHDEGQTCVCVAEHRPPVMEFIEHHIWPTYMGGPDVESNRVFICATTHYNVHEILRLLMRDGMLTYGEVDAVNVRTVPRYSYAMAVEGYRRWITDFAA